MTQTIEFPAPAKLINANQRIHWRRKAELTSAWRWAGRWAGKELTPIPRARIVATFHFTDKRRRDVGNLAPTVKAIVDGLVDAGVFEDDDDTRIIGPDLRRGEQATTSVPRVTITIEPLDGAA